MDISQRGRAVALSFLSPLPELRRWSPRLPPPVASVSLPPPRRLLSRARGKLSVPPPRPLAVFSVRVSSFSLSFSRPGRGSFSSRRPPLPFSARFLFALVPPSPRLTDTSPLNRAGGPPYFCLAGRVHSPRQCSDCDQTETSWALLLAERTIYRIELARETGEELQNCWPAGYWPLFPSRPSQRRKTG